MRARPAIHLLVADVTRRGRLSAVGDGDLDRFIGGFDTQPMGPAWVAPRVREAPDADPEADFTSILGDVPVMSGRALRCLGELLEGHGEPLPLAAERGEYWAYNVTSVADVMDEQRSSGDWFEPGRLMTLESLAIRPDAPEALPPIFKLPQWRRGTALITQEFVDAVRAARLTGLAPRTVTADAR